MSVRIRHITIDCADPYQLALFWGSVTGYTEEAAGPNLPGQDEALIQAPDGSAGLLFIQVPEAKSVKNRVHFDFQPTGATRDEEVDRILGLGAKLVGDFRKPDGTGWAVLADPEGNEFCVERSAAERAGSGTVIG
jgi:predicted enzyme related to lactoylglutathione lyase